MYGITFGDAWSVSHPVNMASIPDLLGVSCPDGRVLSDLDVTLGEPVGGGSVTWSFPPRPPPAVQERLQPR